MAERGAHLTGTVFKKPSIFEIVAQESLASIVEPAFKKIFSFLVTCNVERMTCISLVSFLAASFSETFYGLKRIALTKTGIKQNLSTQQKRLCVILLVLLPYLKSKFDRINQRYKLERADGFVPQNRWQQLFQLCITKGYTSLVIIYEVIVLYRYILYISGRTSYPTPILRLLSLSLTYALPEPILSTSELLKKLKHNAFQFEDGLSLVERLLTRSIELGAFVLQFLSWQNQENYYTNIMSLPVPPPPKLTETAKQYKGICPICYNKPHIHTVVAVSGYIFCYQCILPVIRKTNQCPVTNYPASEDDLIRLYID